MNTEATINKADSGSGDILFECPQCGKSLEIDARGAGYIIVCPDCQTEVQVPPWNATEAEGSAEAPASGQPEETDDVLRLLQARVTQLEKQQLAYNQCFKRIGDEIVLIQAALDRITEIVETRST